MQRHDIVNGNQRIYPKSFFERLFRPGSKFVERLQGRGVAGHIEHPSDGLPDLRKYAVIMTDCGFYNEMLEKYPATAKLKIDDPQSAVIGMFEALSTPDGRIVEALWRDEVQTGASSRAQGSVVTNENQYPQYPKGIDIVQDDVDEETLVWDIVARPSTPGAFPARVQEAINEAQEYYRQEALNEASHLSPPIGNGLGGNAMSSLVEIRQRVSRIKPHMENLDRVPHSKLVTYLGEVNTLIESVSSASTGLNESQQMPVAEMTGELQSLRDKIMAHIGAAFNEAENGKLPGALPMRVADKTTSNMAALNSDPALDYPSSQSLLPGGRANAGAIQEPDKGTSDQSVPGPGVNGGDSKLSPEQSEEERRKQAHGTMVGDAGPGSGAGVSGASIGKKGGTKESITTDQAHRTSKGELGQEVVKADDEGDGMEVDDFGRNISAQPVKAGKTGSADGSKTQGIVASHANSGGRNIAEEGNNMGGEALANLNKDLVKECRALREEVKHWRGKYERANSLVVETGTKHRQQRFKMSMERLIENNPALDNPQARVVLESSRDETHMVQIAEAILGTQARISQSKDSDLRLKLESDGLFRLVVDGRLHEKVLDGQTMFEALLKMGIAEEDVEAAFDDAYVDAEMLYRKPEGAEGEPYIMVPMEPVDDEGGMDGDMDGGMDGDMEGDGIDLDLDFGDDDAGEEVGGDDMDYDDEEPMEEEQSYMGGGPRANVQKGRPVQSGQVGRGAESDADATAAHGEEKGRRGRMAKASSEIAGKGKDKDYMGGDEPDDVEESRRGRFQAYKESRGLAKTRGKRALNESKGKRKRKGKVQGRGRRPVAGSRRMSESLPPAGGAPSSQPPAVRQNASRASSEPASLTERIIARGRSKKKLEETARNEQAKRMNLNG